MGRKSSQCAITKKYHYESELFANIQQGCKSASGHKEVFSRSLKAFIWDSSRLEFGAARLVVIVIIS